MADSYATPSRMQLCQEFLSRAFTAISEISSAKEDCIDAIAHWRTLNPFALEKGVAPGMDFFAASFVVEIESHRVTTPLFAYLNGADSYTKLQLIVFAF